MKEEYIIVNESQMQKRIEELEVLKRIHCYRGPQPNENEFQRYNNEQSTLKQLISKSIPLIPEIENAFYAGWTNEFKFPYDLEEELYISNLKFDI